MVNTIIEILDNAVINKNIIQMSVDKLYNSYCDSTGQRQAYLSFYSYESYPMVAKEIYENGHKKYHDKAYIIRRHCTFTNKGDENKQHAILGVLNIPDILETCSISQDRHGHVIKLNSITIIIRTDKYE